jgi:hypothetical protein
MNSKNNKKNKVSINQDIKKVLKSATFEYLNKIIWNSNLNMEEFINDIKLSDIYTSFNEKININIDNYITHEILGICPLNTYNETSELIYIITDKDHKLIYISIGKCHPIFWYIYNTKSFIENFDKIYECFNPIELKVKYDNNLKGFIGNQDILELGIHDIENHFLINKYSDKLIWGSKWYDHPFRSEYEKSHVNSIESIIFTGQAMRQQDGEYTVSIRTNYSKSLITIYYYDDAYILEINYNKIETNQINNINNIFGRKYDPNIPIDVILSIINFPFVTHDDILDMMPLSLFHFYVVTLLCDNGNIKLLMPKLKNIIEDTENNYGNEVKEYINDYIKKYENDLLISKIMYEIDIYNLIDIDTNMHKLESIVNDTLDKYKCNDNEYIKHELNLLFLETFEIIQKIGKKN